MSSTFLDQIRANNREELAGRKVRLPLESLKETIATLGRPRNFFQDVSKDPKTGANPKPLNLIAEVKKASPSAGVIRSDFDPVKIAQTYATGGGDALSVLTDEKNFQGPLHFIYPISDVVEIPPLRKKFIIDPNQGDKIHAAGADGVFLIA